MPCLIVKAKEFELLERPEITIMKKIVLVVLLLGIAGIAGVVRSHSKSGSHVWPIVINADKQSAGNARDEIRRSFELVAGARAGGFGIPRGGEVGTFDRTA